MNALRNGDLAACFGNKFANTDLTNPVGLPSGRMTLVHRILSLDPNGGRFGIGFGYNLSYLIPIIKKDKKVVVDKE